MTDIVARHPDITRVLHLAAQAGVRYSAVDPYSYIQSNLMGQVVLTALGVSYDTGLSQVIVHKRAD